MLRVKQVKELVYLDRLFTNDGDDDEDIERRGSRRVRLTCSHADIIDLVSGLGPHENTPIFDTWNKGSIFKMFTLCEDVPAFELGGGHIVEIRPGEAPIQYHWSTYGGHDLDDQPTYTIADNLYIARN
ncbi:hypothetical protein EVAR_81916_1 [Eumeta japonica]|uniref:Uncharacterized protein n=1 Tax=Eumeta variegata TaxID=151549 RepID=A0A4C1UYC1_EUMVA|nr:hypothetical protein EVAR_81916_1 [Eumeta japonica]